MYETIAAWASGTILGLLVVAYIYIIKINGAIGRLDRKLDALLKHAGVDLTAAALREAEKLVRAGNKIEAIRVYRDLTGASLADAKAAVEKI